MDAERRNKFRPNVIGVRCVAAFLFLLFSLVAAQAAPEWCARPIGAATTEAMWASIEPLLPEMKRLAGGQDFAVISTPKLQTLANQSDAYREGFRRSYIINYLQDKKDKEAELVKDPENASLIQQQDAATEAEVDRVMKETDNQYSRQFVRIVVSFAKDVSDKDTSEVVDSSTTAGDSDYVDKDDSGASVGVTYVYSSTSKFKDQVPLRGIEHGATILTRGDDLKQMYDNPKGFNSVLEGAKYIFVDNMAPGVSSPLERPDRVLIRLPALENGSYSNLIGLVHAKDKKRFKAFSLLPETDKTAAPWNLDEHLTRSYAAAGKKIAGALQRSHIERGTWTNAATLTAAIEKSVSDGFNPILIGESADDGKVRLAGLPDVFDPAVLSVAARKASMFIFCNSSLGEASRAGFSIEGRIYVNSVAELLGTLGADPKVENSRGYTSPENDAIRRIVDALVSTASPNGLKTLNVYAFTGRPQPPAPSLNQPSTPNGGDQVPYMLFFYGAFGGVCSEFMRWRKLMNRPRGRQYLTPLYIGLSFAFVILAGGVGFIFGRLAPSDLLRSIAAFIAGAGLEEVIKRASRLKAPNVPFDNRGVEASIHEFVSG